MQKPVLPTPPARSACERKEPVPGSFRDRYQAQDLIRRGCIARVYRGRDTHMDRTVAIKVLREVYSTDPTYVPRFLEEARVVSSLEHPNIVQVYDSGQIEGNSFIVMEYVEGTDLRRYMRSHGMLTVNHALLIAHDIALGLAAIHHHGIVHRKVKPQHILLGQDGLIKLTGFGDDLGITQYYTPEQLQDEPIQPATDVYALGIVMYEMLTGHIPFDGDTPVAVARQHIHNQPPPPGIYNPNISAALEQLILRCLEKAPQRRFSDGSQLAHVLATLATTQ